MDFFRNFDITGNTANGLQLRESPLLYFSAVEEYEIERIPSRLRDGPSVVLREGPRESGRSRVWVLLRPDEYGLDEKGVRRVEPTQDERLEPALLVEFNDEGARKLGAMTRASLPEEGGTLQHHIAILVDGMVVSALVVRSEVRDKGIIENFSAEERDRLLKRLRASIEERDRSK